MNKAVDFASSRLLIGAASLTVVLTGPYTAWAAAPAAGPPPASAWVDLSKLPDWGGMWVPDVRDQMRKATADRPPWTPKVAAEMKKMEDDENAGRPFLVLAGCFPHGMPSFMLITHNAIEVLFTPGRVTILGESDGNRLRRIYTDGRSHPEEPEETLHGDSVGHWEGDTLVVDTVAVAPQAYIATTEGVGVPNDGGMHIVERIHLAGPDTLAFDMEITAPKVLTQTWKTTRLFKRLRGPGSDIIEGECVQGQFTAGKDKNGHDVFIPIPQQEDGSIRARAQQ
jgi:hypothetical protein